MTDPLVSVCCITYNHGKFIKEAIEGFLIQRTTFPIEIIIHDDASTDDTANIIREYEEKYPELIKPIYQIENQWSKGIRPSQTYVWPKAKGKYLALCEGDDYWTDPLKLQKQVDFLEKNSDFVIAYHNAQIINQNGKLVKASKLPERLKKDATKVELQQAKLALTMSMCFRNIINEFPPEFYQVTNTDSFLISLLGNYGKGKYMEDIKPACYRIHEGGIWSNSKEIEKHLSQANTFYHLYHYYKREMNREISYYYKQKFKSKYKTAAIIALKSKNPISAVKALRNIFRR